MKKYRIFGLISCLLFSGIANADSSIIYFGNLEVKNGTLKSASGVSPSPGETVLLRVFSEELSALVYDDSLTGQGAYGLYGVQPHLFVRYNSNAEFKEYLLKAAQMINRGPSFLWDSSAEDIQLDIPNQAETIEVFLSWDRVRPTDCYIAYDMTECSTFENSLSVAYTSNSGRNFKLDVRK